MRRRRCSGRGLIAKPEDENKLRGGRWEPVLKAGPKAHVDVEC